MSLMKMRKRIGSRTIEKRFSGSVIFFDKSGELNTLSYWDFSIPAMHSDSETKSYSSLRKGPACAFVLENFLAYEKNALGSFLILEMAYFQICPFFAANELLHDLSIFSKEANLQGLNKKQ